MENYVKKMNQEKTPLYYLHKKEKILEKVFGILTWKQTTICVYKKYLLKPL